MYRTILHVYKGTLEIYRTKREITTKQTSKKKKERKENNNDITAARAKTKLIQADN